MTGAPPLQRAPEYRVGWHGAVRRDGRGAVRGRVERVTPTELTVTTQRLGTLTFFDAGGRWERYGNPDTIFGAMNDTEWDTLR